ncbi:sodium-independent anion transporter, partial [Bacillus cereus]
IIFTGQIASFLGLTGIKKHEAFIANLKEISTHIGTTNFYSVVTALICFFIILITPKILPKLPGSLVGIVILTVIATIFFSGHVPTIGTAYGTIPNALPQFNIPEITVERIQHLIGPAFVIAML